jgi:hypothetical protein
MCDQVIALLSPGHSTSIVWSDDDSDTESVDIDAGDSDRLFTFEVAKTNEQEESAVSRPGFQVTLILDVLGSISEISQMNSQIIMRYEVPPDCPIYPSIFVPRLLPGETVQGLLTAVYVPHQVRTATITHHSYSRAALSHLL